MASLVMLAVPGEKYHVYDGRLLYKKAWVQKGKVKKIDAALLAGVKEDKLGKEDAEVIMRRMNDVKKGFSGWMQNYVTNWWVTNAKNIGLKNHQTNKPILTYAELMTELESNPRMESFVKWYIICYKDTDVKNNVRNGAEQDAMRELNLRYRVGDDTPTNTGGCVGDLMLEVQRKLMEQLNNRSRAKQGLHLVKSRPTFDDKDKIKNATRRNIADFYIVKSDSTGKAESWKHFNVSRWSGSIYQ